VLWIMVIYVVFNILAFLNLWRNQASGRALPYQPFDGRLCAILIPLDVL
jgi:hypothetical protein